ncbi:MAG: glycosyltransferase family 2 protein [Gemmataceae bacterium]
MRVLVAIPVYNELNSLPRVLEQVRRQAQEILVVNDGSTDGSTEYLYGQRDIHLIVHRHNRGYGAAIRSAMAYAQAQDFDILVTMDCDGQHEPARIPVLLEALGADVELVSGSRYLRRFPCDSQPPADRRRINRLITEELNRRFGLGLTDAFCGFKAYRVPALGALRLTENGWGMPLQLWVQAAFLGWRVREVAIPCLYLDPRRSFGGHLDDPQTRLAYYRAIIEEETIRMQALCAGGQG